MRRWLRGVRGDQVEWLRRQGVQRTVELDQELLAELVVQATALGDALCALAAAVLAWRRRFVRPVEAWTLIGAFTADDSSPTMINRAGQGISVSGVGDRHGGRSPTG